MSRSVPSIPTSSTRTRYSSGWRFGAGTSATRAEFADFGVTMAARINHLHSESSMVSSFIDVTRPLVPGMPVYPGEPGPQLTPLARIAAGAPANVSHLAFGLHTGTHVDAPKHFLEGAAGVESLALDALCGPAR